MANLLNVFVNRILHGDCLEVLKTLPDHCVDAIVTDPPYGIGTKEPTIEEIILYLKGGKIDTGGDFMSAEWEIPSVAVWKECLRVLKPGGYLLSFASTRTWDIMSLGIRAAGFEDRDSIASLFGPSALFWIHSQGFPKSLNISKSIEKIEGLEKAAELAKLWKGWGTALKPAWEPILCYRSPIEGTVAEQVVTTGTGALNIDGSRIRHSSPEDLKAHQDMVTALKAKGGKLGNSWKNSSDLSGANEVSDAGRWPSHVLMTHSSGCRQVGTRKVDAPVINRFEDGMKPFGHGAGHSYTSTSTGDAEGKEEIPVYECVSNCPVRVLNASNEDTHGDISRVFAQFVPDAPFYYSPKASRKERNEFLDVRKAPKPKDGIRIMYFRIKEDVDEDIFLRIQEAVNDQTEVDARDLNVSVEKVTPVDVEAFAFEKHLFEHLVPEDLREHFEVDDTVGGNTHPCLHPDSLVLTDQGYQPIKHVHVGQRVLSADGNFHNVEAVTRHAYTSPDLFEIAVSGNDQTSLVSDNHPYLIFRLEGANPLVQWVEAKDIQIGDYTMTPKASLPVISEGLPVVDDLPSVGLLGTHFSISFVKSVKKVPYQGDVVNLSVEGNPTFQTSVGMSHNTVKPRALMRYLVRLVTAKGGIVLDPYCGSGTTPLAAMEEGMQFVGIERDPGFYDIAHRRAAKRLESRVSEDGAEALHGLIDELPQE